MATCRRGGQGSQGAVAPKKEERDLIITLLIEGRKTLVLQTATAVSALRNPSSPRGWKLALSNYKNFLIFPYAIFNEGL